MSATERGLDIFADAKTLRFHYGESVFGPEAEMRGLDVIRPCLLDTGCNGPDPVYGIVMDIGREEHRNELENRYLLFGAVAFAPGLLGREPVRSQGHVHACAPHSGWSPPELFEVWQGRAIVYAQERCGDEPGRCFAVIAEPGEHIIIPPGWPHYVANADPSRMLVFVALCDRQYGFEYKAVRERGGLAWFPLWDGVQLTWQPNRAYKPSVLHVGRPRRYKEFSVHEGTPLYAQFAENPAALEWVAQPQQMAEHWTAFCPIEAPLRSYSAADDSRT